MRRAGSVDLEGLKQLVASGLRLDLVQSFLF